MAKKFIMFSLRLLLLHIVAVVVVGLFLFINNTVVMICVDVLFTFALWYFVWRDAINVGLKDSQKDKIIAKKLEEDNYVPQGDEGKMFKPWFGFLTGLASQSITLMLVIVFAFMRPDSIPHEILKAIINVWNLYTFSIQNAIQVLSQYFYIIPSILFCLVSGLAYLSGPREMRRIETIIERNMAKGPRRVQDEWKAEKRRKKQGGKR